MRDLTAENVKEKIHAAEMELRELDGQASRLWEQIRITPEQWCQRQYVDAGDFWVVGILGKRCLYLNCVEGGWGWGQYTKWGEIVEYHWEQLNINHVVLQTIFEIENGVAS